MAGIQKQQARSKQLLDPGTKPGVTAERMDTTMPTTSQRPTAAIAFLHSSAVHIDAINAMARRLAPGRKLVHVVREDLACAIQRAGGVTPLIEMQTREALQQLADNGAEMIVCTCPQLGAIIEAAGLELREDVGVPVFSARIGFEAALKLVA